mmetsp:Transcript_117962/g.205358  ORF Transcript_117962/g.205358 Transcript_117962/m.205358 type:complete len:222 (-) Transcript_117962:299-964(-)
MPGQGPSATCSPKPLQLGRLGSGVGLPAGAVTALGLWPGQGLVLRAVYALDTAWKRCWHSACRSGGLRSGCSSRLNVKYRRRMSAAVAVLGSCNVARAAARGSWSCTGAPAVPFLCFSAPPKYVPHPRAARSLSTSRSCRNTSSSELVCATAWGLVWLMWQSAQNLPALVLTYCCAAVDHTPSQPTHCHCPLGRSAAGTMPCAALAAVLHFAFRGPTPGLR